MPSHTHVSITRRGNNVISADNAHKKMITREHLWDVTIDLYLMGLAMVMYL